MKSVTIKQRLLLLSWVAIGFSMVYFAVKQDDSQQATSYMAKYRVMGAQQTASAK